MTLHKKARLLVIALATTGLLTACGGGSNKDQDDGVTPPGQSQSQMVWGEGQWGRDTFRDSSAP